MWEDLTIALCGLGFSAAIVVVLLELVVLLGGVGSLRRHRHR